MPSSYRDTIRARRTAASVSSGVAEALLSARNAAVDERHNVQPAEAITVPSSLASPISPLPSASATASPENDLSVTTLPSVVETTLLATTAPEPAPDLREGASTGMLRRGIQFRPRDLELVADMVYACRKGRVRLSGKLGPSIILRAALDQLADVYEHDRPRFLAIMSKYSNQRIGE